MPDEHTSNMKVKKMNIALGYKRGVKPVSYSYKKGAEPVNYVDFDREAKEIAAVVNQVIRVNGSSAFPMPKPTKGIGVWGRIAEIFKP